MITALTILLGAASTYYLWVEYTQVKQRKVTCPKCSTRVQKEALVEVMMLDSLKVEWPVFVCEACAIRMVQEKAQP